MEGIKLTITVIALILGVITIFLSFRKTSVIDSGNENKKSTKRNRVLILTSLVTALITLFFSISINYISFIKPIDSPDEIIEIKIRDTKKNLRSQKGEYNSFQIPSNELVEKKKGSYYIIDLKNIRTKEILKFKAGKYIINSLNKDFGVSINSFLSDFDFLEEQGMNPSIYIIGSADNLGHTTFRSQFEPLNAYQKIVFFPKKNSNMFESRQDSIKVNEPFGNSELPLLRSAFLQDILMNPYGYKSNILEGEVTLNIDPEDRNVNLILYVNWEKK